MTCKAFDLKISVTLIFHKNVFDFELNSGDISFDEMYIITILNGSFVF